MYSKRLERMFRPNADLEKYDNEEYSRNPLLKFRISKVYDQRHFSLLKNRAAVRKLKFCKQITTDEIEQRDLPQSHYINNLRQSARNIVVPGMLRHTELKILSYINEAHRERYPEVVAKYMSDIHIHFDDLIYKYSVKKLLLHPEFDDEDPAMFVLEKQNFHFKLLGRTDNYTHFLKMRNKLEKILLIVDPPVRMALNYSIQELPKVICKFDYLFMGTGKFCIGIGNRKAGDYRTLRKQIHNEIEIVATYLRWTWHPKLINLLKRHFKKNLMSSQRWSRIFVCIEGLINRQVNEMKLQTFRELLETIRDPHRISMLRLFLEVYDFYHEIDISPDYHSIEESYTSMVEEVAAMGEKLERLAPHVNQAITNYGSDYVKIELSQLYVDEIIVEVKRALKITYQPVLDYVEDFRERYSGLYSSNNDDEKELSVFLSKHRQFEQYFNRIKDYFKYITMLLSEPRNEYFIFATLNTEGAVRRLRSIADKRIKLVVEEVVKEHIRTAEEICSEFEEIKERVLEIPKSTESLIQQSEYLIWVKTVKLYELRDRIREVVYVGNNIVELTQMSQYHFDLNIKTINWLKDIDDICDTSALRQEQFKFIFEEHLQEMIKKLNSDVEALIPRLVIIDDIEKQSKYRDYYIMLLNIIEELGDCEAAVKWINKEEELFKMNITKYPDLDVIKNLVKPFTALLKLCIDWLRYFELWMDGPFEYLDPKFVEETTDDFLKEFQKNQKYYRNKIKQDNIEHPICKFKGQVEDPNTEKHPVPIRLCNKMIAQVKDFTTGVFVVGVMCNPALKKRHWKEMSEIAGFDMTPNAGTSLRKILNFGLDNNYDQFEIISISANKEKQLQDNLHAMIHEWDGRYFPYGPYKETGIAILNSLDDIQALLDDHILKTVSMRGSAFMKPCEDEVLNWYSKILRVNQMLEEWGKVQSNFLYLLPIFSSKDIVAQMPEEGRLFTLVENTFVRNMGMIVRQPLVMETAPAPGLLESLEKAVELLEDITNGVNSYLEKKRLYFPRFFFLSNDEMLEILSETKDPLRVQPHLGKCFEGIHRLEFDDEKNVLSMLSSEKEKIEFVEQVSTSAAGGSVEKWLIGVEAEMLKAVHHVMENSYLAYPKSKRNEWVLKWPQMVVLCVSQIFWASHVQFALQRYTPRQISIKELFKELNSDLKDLVDLIRSTEISNLNRIAIKSLIVIDVHGKDVVEELISKKVSNEFDFQWLAQLRYYWENGDSLVRIINATVPYANEYLGNSDRLVITPLTDRCYRTLVAAYQINLNGAPEGPAGTGKTETVKDLAKALAVQCKVFNCSDGLDYKAMGKFFKGLASCGAWACFDEFNRIELEVLSVVAQQILLIIQAVRAKVAKFYFENSEIILNPAVYVCITMNPGYAGRSELPDNLKVLFRAVAMMVPDYAMIGEISLYSYGFVDARKLSVKIVTTYRLCSEQLSSQNHYDYGMRAVKTVLSACGNIKKQFPNESEDILLLRSLLDVNLPKFMSFDVPLFEGIISDIFPGVVMPKTDYSLIKKKFKLFCKEMMLEPRESFLTKVIQTYEMMIVRHGFMLVGDPLAGKSKTLLILQKILGSLKEKAPNASPYFQHVEMGIINPKSITMNQLYGSFDPVSYEWNDGIVPKIFREFAMNPSPDRKWVIFDGPVDAVWIENMNTVLDDNKKLCLTSGEVITMTNEMSMIFEVMDLSQASPATVSRCGMIYMEVATLGWRSFFNSWIKKCNKLWATEDNINYIKQLFEWVLEPCQAFVRKNCKQHLNPGEFNCLNTTFHLFEMLINQSVEDNQDNYEENLVSHFEAAMLFSLVWGVAGILDTISREKFDVFLKKLWSDESAPIQPDITPPIDGLIVDYMYTFKQRGNWRSWNETAKRMELELTPSGVQVPTIDTMRYNYLLEMHIKNQKRMLLVGPTGTGKSSYIQNYLMQKLNVETYQSGFITFTVVITANQTQELLMSKLLKLRRGIYGPPKGQLCVLFVDDMNMPAKEVYGAQPPLELLRQFFDYGYVYDLKDCSKLLFDRLMFVSACGLPGGSRQDVYPRFLNHFNIFSVNTFAPDTVNRIFVSVLLNGFYRCGHGSDVIVMTNQMVAATQYIYGHVQKELLATPSKSHYVFNVRDIERVVTGCSLLRKETVQDKRIFTRVWFHEAMRVFFDRLVDKTDREWLYQKLVECIQLYFRDKTELVFSNYLTTDGEFSMENATRLLFGVYFDEDSLPDDRRYEESPTFEVFFNFAMQSLEDYNSTRRNKLDITLFDFALQHLNRICRIVSMKCANALLIGMGGSGRQSLTKLATNIVQTAFFQPEITKNYSTNDWHDDIKSVLKEAGGRNKHTVFLMTENQIKSELFLQDIDCLLNQGEVPNIFPIDERQEVLELVRLAAQGGNRNIDLSPLQVFSFFVNRCKHNLHIVLCMSPIGDALRKRVRLYPSLVNCCTIDWYENWPEEALQLVSKITLENVNVPTQEIKDSIIATCQYFHVSAAKIVQEFCLLTGRYIYQTNASFLELIRLFQSLMTRKQAEILKAKMRYIGGLDTLANAAEAILIMQTDLNAIKPKLLLLAENSKKMMIEINKETIAASIAAEQVKKDEAVAGVQAQEAQKLKADCERDLRRAMPVLDEALAALNTLKPADITLVKSMKNPPPVIKLIMAAVCVIKGIPADRVADRSTGKMSNDYWPPSKRLLGDMNFLQSLKDFDKDNIPSEIMKRIRKEFIPHKDFQPKIVAKASSAAEGLCKWIIAMDLYDQVAKVVAPKKAKLNDAEKDYADTMSFLEEKRRLAADLEQKVADLNENLERANAEFQRTQDEAEFCKNKLIRAEAIIGGLGGEKSRWTQAAADLQAIYDNLPGDILISSGIIAYLSALNLKYRSQCVTDWFQHCVGTKIPCSKNYSITKTLGLEVTIQNWNIKGLPNDVLSTENAIIASNSSRFSLFIDPQGQANNWIKNMERQNRLSVVKLSQNNYMKVIAEAIEHGNPVIIENILEELEAPLDPILQKKTFIQGGQKFVGLGDTVVPVHDSFRLYLTCGLRNPHFLPEIFNKVTIINFALIQGALEDQLLSIVVAKERPDLQELRMQLISEAARNKGALIDAEDKILSTISSSDQDILESESAVATLNDSRALSQEIIAKQEASLETEKKIEAFRLNYKPVAAHSAIIYYSITDLPNIDPMYQFSLNWYINLYEYSIENANKSKDLPRRVKFLVEAVTRNLYNNVCRSIFERDKLLFSFILTCRLLLGSNQIEMRHISQLVTDANESKRARPNPNDSWITESMWMNILRLEELQELKGFVTSFEKTQKDWQRIYDHPHPEKQDFPAAWRDKITRFEKIIILKALRPDKVFLAIRNFIEEEMGEQFVTPPEFDISKSYQDSNALTPMIFILSPGADPLGSLLAFAEKMKKEETFQSISLGQGQGPIAQSMIRQAQEQGNWVCLQNCHLAVSWMPTLENLWESMDTFNTSPSFRLWLTSYPSAQFPVTLLQTGVKMTNEPPTGLKENILRSYNSEPLNETTFYQGCTTQDRAFTRLLFGICFFHAVVQERRKYGPLGWNISYGFNESDLQISVVQLNMLLNQYAHVPYDALLYLVAECNYGGRVTDTWDRRAIVTILSDYVNPDVVSNLQYRFASGEHFVLPLKLDHREVMRYVETNLPSLAPPEVFGLHANSGITRDLQTTRTLLDSMINLLGSEIMTAGIGSQSADEALMESIAQIDREIPTEFDIDSAKQIYPVEYSESMNTVLVQEMERFLKLQKEIRSSCRDLVMAVKGILVMTPELENILQAIKLNRIPTKWMSKSYPSLKPLGSYIQDLVKRLNWLNTWFKEGKPPTFWLSGFFFTQAFLTGAMQNFARKYKIPIDTLTFDFQVLTKDSMEKAPADGVYVNGLFLEGARWNRETLYIDEQLPKILIYVMPAIYLKPVEIAKLIEGTRYKCPLYKTAERKGVLSTTGHSTNFVIPMLLDTMKKPDHWVKRSVALICQTST